MRRLRLRFDGACTNNGCRNAVATFGWHVSDAATGTPVARGSGTCDGELATNNVAEYEAVIAGLAWIACLARRPEWLIVEGDSMLVVQTLAGRWKCKKPHLRVLRDRARALLTDIPHEIEWIPREENQEADTLSRR